MKDAVLELMEEIAGTELVRQKVQVAKGLPAGSFVVPCKVSIATCDALQCLPPQSILVEASITIGAKGQ